MAELYLVRHGETEWSLSGQHTGRTDLKLTEKGLKEAKHLQEHLKGEDFTTCFSSPLKRALQTADGFSPTIDPNLKEWDYGDYEGITSSDIQKNRPGWNIFKDGAPNGEKAEDVGRRADAFLKRVQGMDGKVAVFSHGHFLRVLAARYLGLDPHWGKIFSLSTASLCILKKDRGQNCIGLWNQTFKM